jgi:hypothetical protein
MQVALIKDGIVFNVVLVAPDDIDAMAAEFAAQGWLAVQDDTCAIGDLYDGAQFTRPAPGVPVQTPARVLTRRQFRQRLTLAEQLIVDNFDVAEYAAGHPKISALTVDQRALVRVALGNYRDVAEVNLDDPDTVQFVGLFGQLGLWDSPERAQAILS